MKYLYRYILLFLAISLSIATAAAQNMSVSGFRLDESDLTANLQGTMVLDQNGEKCALIRIQTTQNGFTFDVGSLGIKKVEYKTAEVWVYVPFGVRRIVIRHAMLGSTTYDFPISIEKARTYVMELVSGEVTTVVREAVTSQYVLFELFPRNAMVEFDGQTLETYDGMADIRKPFGTYSYRVQAPRYIPTEGQITINDPVNKHVVKISLEPIFSNFTVVVNNNAEIWINEKKYGEGRCEVELAYGNYMLEARLPNHMSIYKEINIDRNSNREIFLDTPTPIYGSLDIRSIPANAEIWIDKKKVGTTPMFISQQIIGGHDIELRRSGFLKASQSVEISEGQTTSVNIRLEEDKGVELSSRGTANCYIVSREGVYKFPTVKGNSSKSVGDVASIEVLWESYGTATAPKVGDLVKSVSYADGHIIFEASNKKGNALIAAKDASGNVLWSWHIWMTDKPAGQVYYNNAGTMMDRNLGATSATPGDVGALGLLYQWGRKDPFLGGSAISYSSDSNQAKAASTLSSWPEAVTSDATIGTIAYAQEHPTTFIKYNSSNYDWYYTGSSSTDNTRWRSTKTIYDPCPPGYRVPNGGGNGVWSKALGSSSYFTDQTLYNSTTKGLNLSGKFGEASTIWYPLSGYLYVSSDRLYSVGSGCNYWSISPSSGSAYYLYLNYLGSVDPSSSSRRAFGQSVRCLQE